MSVHCPKDNGNEIKKNTNNINLHTLYEDKSSHVETQVGSCRMFDCRQVCQIL